MNLDHVKGLLFWVIAAGLGVLVFKEIRKLAYGLSFRSNALGAAASAVAAGGAYVAAAAAERNSVGLGLAQCACVLWLMVGIGFASVAFRKP